MRPGARSAWLENARAAAHAALASRMGQSIAVAAARVNGGCGVIAIGITSRQNGNYKGCKAAPKQTRGRRLAEQYQRETPPVARSGQGRAIGDGGRIVGRGGIPSVKERYSAVAKGYCAGCRWRRCSVLM